MRSIHNCRRLLWVVALFASAAGAQAQGYPSRPVRLVVADAAGGAPDQLARLVAQKVSETLGQQVIVDNRPGAGGAIGADLVAKSLPDGYTLLLTTTAIYAILPNLRKDLPYDPVRDFAPVGRIATASNVLVINDAVPAQNVADLVRYAKSHPGTLNYASAGIGTPAHLAGEMLNLLGDVKVVHVPYKGAAPALLDVIAGNAQYIITSPIAAGAHMSAGRVRAIATTGAERNPALPDLPTVADTLPGYEITQSWGIVVPVGTPVDVVKRLGDEFGKALANAEIRDKILKTGAVPASNDSPAAFTDFMARERARLGDVVTRSKIELKE